MADCYRRGKLMFLSGSLYHHFAYLNDGGQVGVVRNVGHDLFCVRPEARLKRLDGITEDVAHANVGRRDAGCAAGNPFVDGVVQTCITQAFLYQWHMHVAVVLVVEAGSRGVRVHHADLDHHCPPSGGMSAQASGIAWGDPVRVWLRGQTGRMAGGPTGEIEPTRSNASKTYYE